jgi:S-formylglutathione hydrolase FrmB
MALVTLHWKSQVLGKQTATQVLLPDVGEGPFPVYYLLHGRSDDHTVWLRRTRLEVYAAKLPLIVVMPDGQRGFYTDNADGPAWAKHIGEELPATIERFFPAKAERAGRAIGGLSGAFGRSYFGAGATLADAARHLNWDDSLLAEMRRIFGSGELRGGAHDPLPYARRAQSDGRMPAMLLDCGTEDFLLEANRDFARELAEAQIPHLYREFSGGHDWDYWDLHVRDALDFHAENLGIHPLA